MLKLSSSNYKWYILALTMLTFGLIGGAERMALPVLFKEISVSLNLSPVSIGTIWGMDPLAGIFTGLAGGLLADRFGIRRVLVAICILSGLFCALRGFSSGFLTMAVFTFLFGLVASMTASIAPKTASVWFKKEQMGLTNALVTVSWSIGAMAATFTSATYLSPLFGGWRNVLFVLGIPAVFLGLLWQFTGREPRRDEMPLDALAQAPPLRQSLAHVFKMRQLWLWAIICLFMVGANMGLMGYLPLYLRNIGWSPADADGVMTSLMLSTTIGILPMVLLSNRLKAHNSMFLFSLVVLVLSLALLPLVKDTGVWVLIVVTGILRSAQPALTNILIFETKGVGSTYGGTAIGMTMSMGMIGGTLGPPLGNSFTSLGQGVPFFFWAALAAVAIPIFIVLLKVRSRAALPPAEPTVVL
jgi:predicted MFS family arabinose efflux permease